MDVKYMDDDGVNIESAVVVCGISDRDFPVLGVCFKIQI